MSIHHIFGGGKKHTYTMINGNALVSYPLYFDGGKAEPIGAGVIERIHSMIIKVMYNLGTQSERVDKFEVTGISYENGKDNVVVTIRITSHTATSESILWSQLHLPRDQDGVELKQLLIRALKYSEDEAEKARTMTVGFK